jgi:CBS domain-containing protein
VRALIVYEAEVNASILLFNLIPAFPLDGGRVLRAALWRHSGDMARATYTAARVGRAFGYVMIAFGIVLAFGGELLGGLWMVLVGSFVIAGGNAERLHDQIVSEFTGVSAQELMTRRAVTIDAGASVDEAWELYARHRHTVFPVINDDGRAIGMLSVERLNQSLRPRRRPKALAQLVDRDPALLVDEHEDVAHLLQEPAFARVGRAAVVDASGRPVGIVSISDFERELRARRPDELGHHHHGAASPA